jgi:hypothetical protein
VIVEQLPAHVPLGVRYAERRATAAEVVAIADQLAGSLGTAHRESIAHGFLSPTQLLIAGTRVVVEGTGVLASVARQLVGLWPRAERQYLAPEVKQGAPPAVRADVYSAAAILTSLLAGPRVDGDEVDMLALVETVQPASLRGALAAALASSPLRRPSSLRELAEDLRVGLDPDEAPVPVAAAPVAAAPVALVDIDSDGIVRLPWRGGGFKAMASGRA